MTTIQIASVDSRSIKIGVSSCIIGEEVRWNGGHSRQRWLTDVLWDFVDYVPVCPEVEVGMGVPRPTVRLERVGDDVRMIDPKNGTIYVPDNVDRITIVHEYMEHLQWKHEIPFGDKWVKAAMPATEMSHFHLNRFMQNHARMLGLTPDEVASLYGDLNGF